MSTELLVLISPRSKRLSQQRLIELALKLKKTNASYLAAFEEQKFEEAGLEFKSFGFSSKASEEKDHFKLFFSKLFFKYLLCPFTLFFKTLLSFPRQIIAAPSVYSLLVFIAGFLVLSKRVLIYEQQLEVVVKDSNSYIYNLWVRASNFFLPLFSSQIFLTTESMKEKLLEFYPAFLRDSIAKKVFIEVFSLPGTEESLSVDEILTNTKTWKKHLSSRADKRSALLSRLEIPEKSLVLLSCSPLEENYSLETLLRAIYAASSKIYLIIHASGSDRNQALSMIVGLGLSEQVVLLPEKESLSEILPAVDALTLACGRDGPSEYFLNAIEFGTPIISGKTNLSEELLSVSTKTEAKSFFDPEHVGELSLFLDELSTKGALQDLKKKSFLVGKEWPDDWAGRVSKALI